MLVLLVLLLVSDVSVFDVGCLSGTSTFEVEKSVSASPSMIFEESIPCLNSLPI